MCPGGWNECFEVTSLEQDSRGATDTSRERSELIWNIKPRNKSERHADANFTHGFNIVIPKQEPARRWV
jgi:hypothetical protein